MAAWFLYWLNGDTEAGSVFFREEAAIISNLNWQDAQKNNLKVQLFPFQVKQKVVVIIIIARVLP